MKLKILLTFLSHFLAGNIMSSSAQPFGSCNEREFVEQAVGICEKIFYIELAKNLTADCRMVHAQLSTCFVKKTRQCLAGHLSEDQIDNVVNKTALFLKKTGSPQWYCSNKPTNMSSLDPDLRQHLPCSDKLFSEGHKCTKDFREIFNTNRNDPRLCGAFSAARNCTQSVFDRYCNGSIQVPTENQFNPFCNYTGNATTVAYQASKTPETNGNCTQTAFDGHQNDTIPVPTQSRFNQFYNNTRNGTTVVYQASRSPEANGAHRNIKLLSRMFSVTLAVIHLNNDFVIKGLGSN